MNTPIRPLTSHLSRLGLGLALTAALLGVSGCAHLTSVAADVSSYGQWPPERKQQRYMFERLPSQQANADFQGRVEAAVAPMLARKGFVPVASADQADVLIQVAAKASLYDDPYRRMYDGGFFGGRFGMGGGIWGGRGGGVGIGINLEPAQTQMQVDVLIRDRRSSQTLYETHAVHLRYGSVAESVMPALFEAALLDFPAQAISPRRVLVEPRAAAPTPESTPTAAPKP